MNTSSAWHSARHRKLVRELLVNGDGDEAKLRRTLIDLALDTVAATASLLPGRAAPSDHDQDELPSAEDVLADELPDLGLHLNDFVPGRPTVAFVSSSGGPIRIGEDDENQVVIDSKPVAAKVVSLAMRGPGSNAVFGVTMRDVRMRYEHTPDGCDLVFLVLRAENRIACLTRGELVAYDEALTKKKRFPRVSRGPNGSIRIALPRTVTGLDLRFPRVARVNAESDGKQ